MKITKTIGLLFLSSLVLFAGCNSTSAGAKEEKREAVHIEPSQHLPVPDTSSTIVTEAQPLEYEDVDSIEFTRLMGNGINLGNTMEAYRYGDIGTKSDPKKYEVLWGQPITTQKTMDSFKEAGFDSVRIPVAWTNAMDYEHGDYIINTPYLDRVEEIVNYALEAGLIVVLNDHWDGSWTGMFGSENPDTRKDAWELYEAMWTQIAVRFKNYSDLLVFEGANEEVGNGFNRADVCIDSGFLSEDECYETGVKFNQKFVDIVRATGGNNASRFLLIPGINTNITNTCDDRFTMPEDTAEGKLIISVHFYDPWGFCGDNGSVTHFGKVKDLADMNNTLGKMQKFTEQGYGVIIGEYGVLNKKKDGTVKEDAFIWYNNFLDNCDMYGYCPMLWETSNFFKREVGFMYPELKELFLQRSYDGQDEDNISQEELAELRDISIEDRWLDAPELLSDNDFVGRSDVAVAWIMYNGADWTTTYSVGDVYNPDATSDGIKATDVQVTGEGTYTVALDFTGMKEDGSGTARGFAFSALAIGNGEDLFPGYVIDIKEMKVNGEPYALTSKPYTCSDDGHCTRVNIYNEWVTNIPKDIRTTDGERKGARAIIVQRTDPVFKEMKTLEITFEYRPQ